MIIHVHSVVSLRMLVLTLKACESLSRLFITKEPRIEVTRPLSALILPDLLTTPKFTAVTCITGLLRQRNWYDSSKCLDKRQIKLGKSIVPLPRLPAGEFKGRSARRVMKCFYFYFFIEANLSNHSPRPLRILFDQSQLRLILVNGRHSMETIERNLLPS